MTGGGLADKFGFKNSIFVKLFQKEAIRNLKEVTGSRGGRAGIEKDRCDASRACGVFGGAPTGEWKREKNPQKRGKPRGEKEHRAPGGFDDRADSKAHCPGPSAQHCRRWGGGSKKPRAPGEKARHQLPGSLTPDHHLKGSPGRETRARGQEKKGKGNGKVPEGCGGKRIERKCRDA